MRIKWTWALFVPFFAVMVGLRIYRLFFMGPQDSFLGMNNIQVTYLNVILAGVLFLLCFLVNLADRKTADILPPSRNIISGLLSLVCAGLIIATSAYDVYGMVNEGRYILLWLVCSVLGVLSAIGFIAASAALFSGKNKSRGISVLFLLPAVWSAAMLIATFSEFTWLSVRNNDSTIIVAYVFLTMFFFYHALVFTVFKEKGAVKKLFVFGFPCVGLLTVCGITSLAGILSDPNMLKLENILFTCQLFALAVYVLSITVFASARLVNKKDLEAVSELSLEQDTSEAEQNYLDIADKLEEEENEVFTISHDNGAAMPEPHTEPEKETGSADEVTESAQSENPVSEQSGGESGFGEASQMLDELLDNF